MLSRAYLDARHARYSKLASVRVALLVARLSLRDPPTDTWGRRLEANGQLPILPDDPYADPTQGRTIGERPYEDPTQGNKVGSDPYEDPTRAR